MSIRFPSRVAVSVLAVLAVLAGTACSASSADEPDPTPSATEVSAPPSVTDASVSGMRVLLTNDDSMQASRENNSDGLGIYEMRRALCAAGADVVVLAPWAVQSGRGTAVTNSGVFTAAAATIPAEYAADCQSAPAGGAVFGLCLADGGCGPETPSATPVDTVKFALRGGLSDLVGWTEDPDMVVSGPNAGLNVASSVNDSGTVGAAIAAVESHVPAFAVSASFDGAGSYPVENYQATSEWTVELVEAMVAREMLNDEAVINVNYPDTTSGKAIEPAVFVEVGTAVVAYHGYTKNPNGSYQVAIEMCEGKDVCAESKDDADWKAVLESNAIAVGAITPDRSYGPADVDPALVAQLKAFVETAAPRPANQG